MGDTFGGTWNRPRTDKRHDRQRGHSLGSVRQHAGYDNQAQTGCGALFLIATILTTAVTASVRKASLRHTDWT